MRVMTLEDLFNEIKNIVQQSGTCPSTFDVSAEDFSALCTAGEISGKLDTFIADTPYGLVKIRAYNTRSK